MSLAHVLGILEERGLELFLGDDGLPWLKGKRVNEEFTPALREALKEYRPEIIQHLGGTVRKAEEKKAPVVCREWLWRQGNIYREHQEDSGFQNQEWHPTGAWWWRMVGENVWQPVPGRNKNNEPLPDGAP